MLNINFGGFESKLIATLFLTLENFYYLIYDDYYKLGISLNACHIEEKNMLDLTSDFQFINFSCWNKILRSYVNQFPLVPLNGLMKNYFQIYLHNHISWTVPFPFHWFSYEYILMDLPLFTFLSYVKWFKLTSCTFMYILLNDGFSRRLKSKFPSAAIAKTLIFCISVLEVWILSSYISIEYKPITFQQKCKS